MQPCLIVQKSKKSLAALDPPRTKAVASGLTAAAWGTASYRHIQETWHDQHSDPGGRSLQTAKRLEHHRSADAGRINNGCTVQHSERNW